MSELGVSRILENQERTNGAGVLVNRAFGVGTERLTDPFLLLDEICSKKPKEYIAGFPLHPHRGIETITYMLQGFFRFSDSLGNSGILESGGLLWLCAGSGIIHEEMPLESSFLHGFQLWINTPKSEKGRDPFCHVILPDDVPRVPVGSGTVKILSGAFGGVCGPLTGISGDPLLLDISLNEKDHLELTIPYGNTVILHIYQGCLLEPEHVQVGLDARKPVRTCLLLGNGDHLRCTAGKSGLGMVLAAAKPIGEPMAWKGGIVMCTQDEVDQAYKEFSNGTFVKVR